MNAVVLFEEIPCASGSKIGVATLNTPQTLNGLSREMNKMLDEKLIQWATDPALAVVVLRGAGDKAFCAGGDLHHLYQSMLDHAGQPGWNNSYASAFFSEEYRLDYRIHTYPKPILCWGDGIVMGGGMGLMGGASHRVVTETSRLAMPEITIGLFPDVGGTWMMNKLPGRLGLFLALTGAQFGASDALYMGMADYCVARGEWDNLIKSMQAQTWEHESVEATTDRTHRPTSVNDERLHRLLSAISFSANLTIGPIRQHIDLIQHCCAGHDLETIVANILNLSSHEDAWLQRAAKTLKAGSPGSARLSYALLRQGKHLSLAQVFRMEYIAALGCASHGDFQEGIRALLIDKDKQPKWNPATLHEASASWVEKFFMPLPPGMPHPLHDLGDNR